MAKVSFTGGPWETDRHTWWENTPGEQEKHGGLIIYPKYDEDLTIAEVNDYFDKEQGKANAHLISAAPEMYEALKRLTEYGDIYRYRTNERNPYEQAMEALKKAEGGE